MTRNKLRLSFACVLVVLAAGVAYAQTLASGRVASSAPDELHQLWSTHVTPILKAPIPTTSQGAYYDGEMLLVPLHGAFLHKDAAWEQEFAEHLQRMTQAESSLTDVDTSRLQYLYLASQFVVLATQAGKRDLIPKGLPEMLFNNVREFWQQKPAWQWDRPAFKGGMRERLLWKLSNKNVAKSYYRAVLDADFFLFAIAADLRSYGGVDQSSDRKALINDVLTLAQRTCKQEIRSNDAGGWILQPGVWTDHPDYKYAGHSNAGPGMVPVGVRNISWDTSHFMRWPPILASLMNAYPEGSSDHQYYSNLEDGLNTQFFSKVLVPPSAGSACYRTTNYIDGNNGLFRWNYKNIGEGGGYSAYKASGALVIGWWGFLDSDQSRSMYHKMADQYPWPQDCIDLYLGPVAPGHARSAAERDPKSPAMRFRYLIVRFASEL